METAMRTAPHRLNEDRSTPTPNWGRATIIRALLPVRRLDSWLVYSALGLGALSIPFALGIWLDPRLIGGAPAWLKPLKFAISTAIYAVTLAWVLTWIPSWTRTRRIVARTTASVMVFEVAIIALQAARGTTSHFNIGTPLDSALFSLMGLGIALQTITSMGVAYALWREPHEDSGMGWALRFGMTITIAGALVGGLMTRPTDAQMADARASQPMRYAGAHTVGGPDGGPGLPLTGWSTRHGDLRVPHFVGLHAIQVLPLLAWLTRNRVPRVRRRLAIGAASIYGLAFGLLLAQALGGLPFTGVFS